MINPYSSVVDVVHITDIYEAYVTYVDDEYLDNHDYDDETDDDTDNDAGDDTDDYLYPYYSMVCIKYLRRLLSGSPT